MGDRILVVDDEKTIRNVVRTILERAGYEVSDAEGAEQALALLHEGPQPSLLLTDIVMPGKNGFALAAMAHHRWPAIPILFMSGFAKEFEEELSGSVCVRKPFIPSQLVAAVEDLLRAKSRLQQQE